MFLQEQYPFTHHPCFSNKRGDLWARIHLPVALKCNVKCIFCDHNNGSSCHTSKPGYSASLLSPAEAIDITRKEMNQNPNLKIIAISGPGEPLYNAETFEVLESIRKIGIECKLCLSTNGVLLGENAETLGNLGVDSISVSMNGISPEVVASIYEWAVLNGNKMNGTEMAKDIISRQLEGIEIASKNGITVKVNTVLIPELNTLEIHALARQVSIAGAVLQNIVPLIPCSTSQKLRPPTNSELTTARSIGSTYLPQFSHCKQCRSDVVGIPGDDRIL